MAGAATVAEQGTQWWEVAIPVGTAIVGVLIGSAMSAWRGSRDTLRKARVDIYLRVLPPLANAVNEQLRVANGTEEPQPIPITMEGQYIELQRYAITAGKRDARKVKRFHRLWNELWWNRGDYVRDVHGLDKEAARPVRLKHTEKARELWGNAHVVMSDYEEFLKRKLAGWRVEKPADKTVDERDAAPRRSRRLPPWPWTRS